MNARTRFPLAALLLALLVGGCPYTPATTGGSSGSTTSPSTSGTTPGSTTGPTVTGGSTFRDDLDDRFPGCTEPSNGDAWRDEVFDLVNDERDRYGVAPLVRNDTLDNQADQYACEMIYYEFFAHENPITGTTLPDRADEFSYDYAYIGENLAAGQQSPVAVVRAWMNSTGHRDAILDDGFDEVGVGVRVGGPYGTYWVLEFGRPR